MKVSEGAEHPGQTWRIVLGTGRGLTKTFLQTGKVKFLGVKHAVLQV